MFCSKITTNVNLFTFDDDVCCKAPVGVRQVYNPKIVTEFPGAWQTKDLPRLDCICDMVEKGAHMKKIDNLTTHE